MQQSSKLRVVNGALSDLKTLRPTWERPGPAMAVCPKCGEQKALRKFFSLRDRRNPRRGEVRTRRCSQCLHEARRRTTRSRG